MHMQFYSLFIKVIGFLLHLLYNSSLMHTAENAEFIGTFGFSSPY